MSKQNINLTIPRGQTGEDLNKIFTTNKGLLSLKASVMEEVAGIIILS